MSAKPSAPPPAYSEEFSTSRMLYPSLLDAYSGGGGEVLYSKMCDYITRNEITPGLIASFHKLAEMELVFIIDDSGSMLEKDAVTLHGRRAPRWEELKERLGLCFSLLAHTTFTVLTVRFLNNRGADFVFIPNYRTQTQENVAEELTRMLNVAMSAGPGGGTPLVGAIREATNTATPTAIFVFTDGEPHDSNDPVRDVTQIIQGRAQPRLMPIMFNSCSGNDNQLEWLKTIEKVTMPDGSPSFVGELDDYDSEWREISRNQCGVIKYPRGMWIAAHLLGAIDLSMDALDDEAPLTKADLEHITGRVWSENQYRVYWNGMWYKGSCIGRDFHTYFTTTLSVQSLPQPFPLSRCTIL